MVPIAEGPDARLHLGDLCEALTEHTGIRILPHRAPSPASLASAVVTGRVQLAWLSPTLLVSEPGLASVIPLVSSVREGVATYHSCLFSDERSTIRGVSHLAGSRVAWVAPTSAAGYLVPRVELAERGLDPTRLFAHEAFLDSHGAVARAVYEGRADVGATFAVFEGGEATRPLVRAGFQSAAHRAHIVLVGGPIPSDVIAATSQVIPEAREKLTSALEHLSNERATNLLVRSLFGADAFARFTGASRAALERMVEAGRRLGRQGKP